MVRNLLNIVGRPWFLILINLIMGVLFTGIVYHPDDDMQSIMTVVMSNLDVMILILTLDNEKINIKNTRHIKELMESSLVQLKAQRLDQAMEENRDKTLHIMISEIIKRLEEMKNG